MLEIMECTAVHRQSLVLVQRALFLILVSFVLLLVLASSIACADDVLLKGTGPSMVVLGPVETTGPVDVRWAACGDMFYVDAAHTVVGVKSTKDVIPIGGHGGAGGGSSYLSPPGKYYFGVVSAGGWYLEVVTPPREDKVIAEWIKPYTEIKAGPYRYGPFKANGPWTLRWATCSDHVTVHVYPTDGSGKQRLGDPIEVADSLSIGSGSYEHRYGGHFIVEIWGFAGWYGRVVEAGK